jgi:hypothetical protein
MFKILVLQKSLSNVSDYQTELQIKDRLSFMRFWVSISKTQCQMRKPFGCSEIRSQTKMPSINCSASSIDILIVKVCLHVKGNSSMPALCRFLCNAILGRKIPTSNKAKFQKTGKNNRTNFNRRILMIVG